MKRLDRWTYVLTLIAACLCFGTAVFAQDGPALSTSQPKGRVADVEAYVQQLDGYMKGTANGTRSFANSPVDVNKTNAQWRELRSDAEHVAAENDDATGETAQVWSRDGKVVVAIINFKSSPRGWNQIVKYYFRGDSSLAKSDSTLNTVNGITVLRQDYYDAKGMLLKGTTHCMDAKTQQSRPCGEYQDKPAPFYKNVRQLPFASVLAKKS